MVDYVTKIRVGGIEMYTGIILLFSIITTDQHGTPERRTLESTIFLEGFTTQVDNLQLSQAEFSTITPMDKSILNQDSSLKEISTPNQKGNSTLNLKDKSTPNQKETVLLNLKLKPVQKAMPKSNSKQIEMTTILQRKISTLDQKETSTKSDKDLNGGISELIITVVIVSCVVLLLMLSTLLVIFIVTRSTGSPKPSNNDMDTTQEVDNVYENIQAYRMKVHSAGSGYADIIFGNKLNEREKTPDIPNLEETHEDDKSSIVTDLGYAQSNIGGSWVDIQSHDTDFSYGSDTHVKEKTYDTVQVSFPIYF